MSKYAIIDGSTVFTVADWDGSSSWSPPKGMILVALDDGERCAPGATYAPSATPRFILPPVVNVWTAYQFLGRFTDAELMAIRAKSQTDAATWKFLTFATAAQEVVSNDPMTVAGMDYLVSVGILTPLRKAEILGL